MFYSGRVKAWKDEEGSFHLKITNLQEDDESLYEAKVRNEHGGEICSDFQLLVGDDEESEEDEEDEEEKVVVAAKAEVDKKADAESEDESEEDEEDDDESEDSGSDEDDSEVDAEEEKLDLFVRELDECYNVLAGESVLLVPKITGEY